MPIFYDRKERNHKTIQKEIKQCPFCDNSENGSKAQYRLLEFQNPYFYISYNKFPYGGVQNRDKMLMAIPYRHVEHTSDLSPEERQAMHEVELFMKNYFGDKPYFMFIREHRGHKSVPHIHFHFVRGKIHSSQVASMME